MPPNTASRKSVRLSRYWKACLSTVLVLVAFSGRTRQAEAQQATVGPVGRYQIFASPASPQAVVLLDTQTGRTWLFCNTKSDSAVSAKTTVDNNWCAMHFLGAAPRP